jgi:hypothetical protein
MVESEEISETLFFSLTLTGLIARENFSVYSHCICSDGCYRRIASKGNKGLKREEFPKRRRRELRRKTSVVYFLRCQYLRVDSFGDKN